MLPRLAAAVERVSQGGGALRGLPGRRGAGHGRLEAPAHNGELIKHDKRLVMVHKAESTSGSSTFHWVGSFTMVPRPWLTVTSPFSCTRFTDSRITVRLTANCWLSVALWREDLAGSDAAGDDRLHQVPHHGHSQLGRANPDDAVAEDAWPPWCGGRLQLPMIFCAILSSYFVRWSAAKTPRWWVNRELTHGPRRGHSIAK